jgi:homoserine dehydrogenase
MERLNVGIIGFGTVGTGTFEVLMKNRSLISDRVGMEVNVKSIADLDVETNRGISMDPKLLTTEATDVIDDPEIDVIVELIGGLDKAWEYILRAMEKGKHVVTANKALLADRGSEIYQAAARHGVNLAFEASVGGGIPIICALRYGLSANRILTMMGILNGTSNFILTRMGQEELPYSQAVEEAVALGFAEDPPTLDVSGTDAAHKLAIFLSMAFGAPFPFNDIYIEGIDTLTPEDIRFADEFGYCIKLLAIMRTREERVEARVHPTMIPKSHILANVIGAYNAIYLEGDFAGAQLYYGLGAGSRPTGSAVVSDIMDLARQIKLELRSAMPPLGRFRSRQNKIPIQPMKDLKTAYYFRFSALDRPGVLSKISGILGDHQISISSVIQKGREERGSVPVVMLTHPALESQVLKAVSLIDKLDVVTQGTVAIRLEEGHSYTEEP